MVLSEFYLGIEIFWGGSRRVGGGGEPSLITQLERIGTGSKWTIPA